MSAALSWVFRLVGTGDRQRMPLLPFKGSKVRCALRTACAASYPGAPGEISIGVHSAADPGGEGFTIVDRFRSTMVKPSRSSGEVTNFD
jgi:hypothetical protein